MKSQFEIHGYHKELFHKETGKYVGYIPMSVPDRAESKFGYFGRATMHVKGTARKSIRTFTVNDEFITECIPICGKIIGDKHKTIQQAHEWRNQFGIVKKNH